MSLTTDPKDPRLTHGVDDKPVPQAEAYLIISDEERSKGFVRPVRRSYVHRGIPDCVCRDSRYHHERSVAEDGQPRWGTCYKCECTGFEVDDATWSGCQHTTTMGQELAETWARDTRFYGATYCATCQKHLAIEEFTWQDGSMLGS